jgi:hypothetical protein
MLTFEQFVIDEHDVSYYSILQSIADYSKVGLETILLKTYENYLKYRKENRHILIDNILNDK